MQPAEPRDACVGLPIGTQVDHLLRGCFCGGVVSELERAVAEKPVHVSRRRAATKELAEKLSSFREAMPLREEERSDARGYQVLGRHLKCPTKRVLRERVVVLVLGGARTAHEESGEFVPEADIPRGLPGPLLRDAD